MTTRTISVKCPECEAEDHTVVELEDWTTEYFIVTECAHCTNPYAIGITINVLSRPCRIVKAD